MDPVAIDLSRLTRFLLEQAVESPQNRASQRFDLDHEHLRMTAIGFDTGGTLPSHHNPGEAVLQVVHGRVRVTDAVRTVEVEAGTVARVPAGEHSVEALEPSVIVLTAIALPRSERTAAL